MAVCFCTLAIHAPYRQRARALCADPVASPWVVLTDDPDDFADLPVRAVRHEPTGPMAADYLQRLIPTGQGRGAAAYHDKRFAVQAALEDSATAIFLDADSRVCRAGPFRPFPPGLAVLPTVRASVTGHLRTSGAWRLPVFTDLAIELVGDPAILDHARWCHETCYAVTKDGREDRFFRAWERAARFLQDREVFSGEGGVMGIAAACAGWSVDYAVLARTLRIEHHEGGGPKTA